MKRIMLIAAVAFMAMFTAQNVSAGILGKGLGVTAGANFSSIDGVKELNLKQAAGFNFGIVYDFNIPIPVVGFHIQPSLTYTMKSASLGVEAFADIASMDFSVGYLEFMASIQPGIDLLALRAFLDISPYVGYAVNGTGDIKGLWKEDAVNKLQWGLGLGAGVNVWKLQLVARYNWNFGGLMKTVDAVDQGFGALDAYKTLKGANFGGVTVSAVYFF